MKYVKILGLAALVTAALLSLAGTASATVLCSVEPSNGTPSTIGTVCPAGFAYPGGTELHSVLETNEHATFTDQNGKAAITCTKSTIAATTENEGSAIETVRLKVGTLTFEDCTSPALGTDVACEVKVLKNGTLELHWTADSFHATITSSGTEITTDCPETLFGDVHCIYTTSSTDLGLLTGAAIQPESRGTLDIASAKLGITKTSTWCPTEVKWDGKYEVTSPKTLWVAAHT